MLDSDNVIVHGVSDYTDITVDHEYTQTVTPPSCAKGYTTYTCICGHSYKADYVPAVTEAHTIKKVKAKKATLKSDGNTAGSSCTVCSEVFEKSKKIYKIKTVKLSATSITYNGKNRKPKVTVTDSKGKIISASNYKVTYPSKTSSVGTYSVKIVFKGNYSGTVTRKFKIVPAGTSLTKLTRLRNGVTVEWKKQNKNTTGYQLQYSLKKDFSDAKTVTVKKNTTLKSTVKKLKGDKNYYLRVRTYFDKKSSKKTQRYYSKWTESAKILVTSKSSARIVPQSSKAATIGAFDDEITVSKYYQTAESDRATLYTEVGNKYKGYYPYKILIYMSTSKDGKYKRVAEDKQLGTENGGVHYGWVYVDNLKPDKIYYFKLTVVYVPTSCLYADSYKKLTVQQKIFDSTAPILKFRTAPAGIGPLETYGNVLTWNAYKGAVGYYVCESTNEFQGYNIYGERVYARLKASYVVTGTSATSYKVSNNMEGAYTEYTVYPIVKMGDYYYCNMLDVTKSMYVEPEYDMKVYA